MPYCPFKTFIFFLLANFNEKTNKISNVNSLLVFITWSQVNFIFLALLVHFSECITQRTSSKMANTNADIDTNTNIIGKMKCHRQTMIIAMKTALLLLYYGLKSWLA